MANPSVPDLLKDSSNPLGTDNEYFLVTIVDLDLATTYPIQFRWKYKDGKPSENWSAVYNVPTSTSTVPNTPQLQVSDVVGDAGFIKVTWSGNDSSGNPITNIDRVDVHISGSSFGDGTTPSGNFKKAGTLTFAATPGVYIVQLKAYRLNGASSFFSTTRTVTVTAPGETIETPTLPSGLSSSTAPFALTVNWDGTYSTSTFTGFKSIDIYAVGSDLGSSVTSGITSTNLVGSLTVNNTPNKINISLDNLRQALSLGSNSAVYNDDANGVPQPWIYLYYNASNKDGTKFGSPTYTRINSSALVPTKANFVDLTRGIISIENLVAGNGQFSSWLRTGTSGGARIELSAVSDFTNGGNTVQKGLVAYSSGNTEIFNLDIDAGTLTINGSGTFSGSLSAASGTFTGALNIGTPSGGLYPFSVSSSGVLRAISGTIGGLTLSASSITNSGGTFALDSGGKARFGSSAGSAIIIDPAASVGSAYIYHSSNGGSTASGNFTVSSSGILTATGGNFSGTITNGSDYWNSNGTFRFGGSSGINYNGSSITLGSSGNPITINTSTGSLSIGGTLVAGSIVLSNGDYWNIGSGFQLGGASGIKFAGSTVSIGSTGNALTINTTNGNVSIAGNLAASSVTINATTDFWTSGGFRLGGSSGINYSGSGNITIGSSGNPVTINTSTGNVSIGGTLTANAISLSSGDFWNSNGDFQLGGSTGITYSANSVSIGNWRVGINSGAATYGVIFGKDLDVFLYGKSTDTYAMVTNTRGISIATAMSPSSIAISTGGAISAGGRVVGVGTSGSRSEFAYLNITGFMSISGGYGVDTNWSPNTDNSKDLGLATSGPGNDSSNIRWRRLYANNTTVSTSDIRLKKDVIDSPLGLDFINNLRPVAYKWIEGSKEIAKDEDGNEIQIGTDSYGKPIYQTISIPGVRRHYGFIAQEVKEAIDDAGVDDFAGWVKDNLSDPESYQSLSYEQFTSPIVKAIQELSQKISSIESRLDALEG